MKNKTDILKLRLTPEEKQSIKAKAENYKSISAFVIHACLSFDDRLSVMKLNYIEGWLEHYKQYKNEFNSLANNINQIAHYVNTLNRAGILSDIFLIEDKNQREKLLNLLTTINDFNCSLENNFKDFIKRKI